MSMEKNYRLTSEQRRDRKNANDYLTLTSYANDLHLAGINATIFLDNIYYKHINV